MSTFVFTAVLFSALLHAVWNAYAKSSNDKLSHFVVMAVADLPIALIIVLFFQILPPMEAVPYLIGTAVAHVFYRFLLSTNYETGDLGFVYPISRGSAPLIVLVLSLLVIQDSPSPLQLLGIVLISISILSFGFNRAHHSKREYVLILLTGLSIASYSFFGGVAARIMDNAWLAIAYVTLIDGPAYLLLALKHDKQRVFKNIGTCWKVAAIGGVISFIGYGIATWAMTLADMSAVTALRATSVLFATMIGVFFLKEKLSAQRFIAAIVIVLGIAVIKLG